MSSYLVPLYFLPITIFAALWLATMAWGMVLCSPASRVQRVTWPARVQILLWLPAAALVSLSIAATGVLIDALMLLTAASVFLFGLYCEDRRWVNYLLVSIVAAAAISVPIALIQLLYPHANFVLVAPIADAARATANLRQPNLFAQLLLLACVGLMFLASPSKISRAWVRYAIGFVLGCGVAFSQSRTGFLGLLLLVTWGLLDKGLPMRARRVPWLGALGCGIAMGGMLLVAHLGGGITHIEAQQSAGSDISSSRFGIWRNALSLIAAYPLTGVGWGQFAQAWALTPFPDRPRAAFDNAHNLPLHFMVELGVPLAVLVLTMLLVPLWRARRAMSYELLGEDAFKARCVFAMLALLGIHSLLEYPLWFSFFLLPAAFLFGQFVQLGARSEKAQADGSGTPTAAEASEGPAPFKILPLLLQGIGIAIVLGSLFAVWDYSRVLQVFRPFNEGHFQSLDERIAEGSKSKLFGYWVDYAVVTNAESYIGMDAEMQRAFHGRMNPHMLLVYAKYLNERGDTDKAAYVAERLREFKSPVAIKFFAECDNAGKRATAFQCSPPKKAYTFKDFG
ncbi:Wzy polymerase domain-containing protein [Sphaerotilaceae bacterium SBD11-9]